MTGLAKIEERENYLYCVAEQFDSTLETYVTLTEEILAACRASGKSLIFLDFTANSGSRPASLRVMGGLLIEKLLRDFQRDDGRIPRVAVLDAASSLSTYKPMQGVFEEAGMPVAMFTEEDTAREWLFKEEGT